MKTTERVPLKKLTECLSLVLDEHAQEEKHHRAHGRNDDLALYGLMDSSRCALRDVLVLGGWTAAEFAQLAPRTLGARRTRTFRALVSAHGGAAVL